MRRPRWILALLIVPLLLLPGCKKAEDPGGPPGPIIIIKPPTGGGSLTWSLDTNLDGSIDKELTAGPPITDSSDAANYCKLREDFIGLLILELSMEIKGGGQIPTASEIVLTGTDYAVKIIRKADESIKWEIHSKVSGAMTLKCDGVTQIDKGDYDEETVPLEFTQLTEITHTASGDTGDKVELQVEMPKAEP